MNDLSQPQNIQSSLGTMKNGTNSGPNSPQTALAIRPKAMTAIDTALAQAISSTIATIGVVNLYSATSVARAGLTEMHLQQIYWFVTGGLLATVVAAIDYDWFNFNHDYTFYVVVYGWVFLLWAIWVKRFAPKSVPSKA